jgi:ubiquinone/menaquinone biosynthesis C-methylase UbiE
MSLAAMVLADRSERLVRFYDRWIAVVTLGRDRRVRRAVLAEVKLGDRLLDVGCGTGTLAIDAASLGARVVAIDRSPAMLAVARQKAEKAGVAVAWREGEASFPPTGDGPFDVVSATFVLSELSGDLAELSIRRLGQLLRPGGRLVIADEAAPRNLVLRLLAAMLRSILAVLSFAILEELTPTRRHPWRTLLDDAGLDVVSEAAYQGGGLVVLVARRPEHLTSPRRPVKALGTVLPTRARGAMLRAAAWLDLPISVAPGVYSLGRPDRHSPVLLTGNFLASVEAVRAGMTGLAAYVVVEDTGGWNVWCAADAGRFNGAKAAALLELSGLSEAVEHRQIVVPRLGGRVRSQLEALAGWNVVVGPLEARDLSRFLSAGLGPEMHSLDRLYRLPERIRVAVLTLVQLPLFLFPLRWLPRRAGVPAWRFSLAAGCLLPIAHYRLPGRTGVAKGTYLGIAAALAGTLTRRVRPTGALAMIATAPLVGWIYQSSSPVVFWKRLWR